MFNQYLITTKMYKFKHFIEYQNGMNKNYPSFEKALYEILVEEKKSTHWIWYIIPYDRPSKQFGDLFLINSKDVVEYLQNVELRNNYLTMMTSIFTTMSKKEHWYNYNEVMSSVDIKKVIVSAKLFKDYSFDLEIVKICSLLLKLLNPIIYHQNEITKVKKKLTYEILN